MEHAIAQTTKRLAQADALRAVIARSKRQRRFTAERSLIEIVGADLRGPKPIPPSSDEASPHRALAVGCFQHFIEIAEESLDAGCLKHATEDLRPVFITADGARSARTA